MKTIKATSSKTIIAKVFRDLRPEDDYWIADAIEWMGEALEHIGAYSQLEKKQTVIQVSDHKFEVPSDLMEIQQIAYSNKHLDEDVTEEDMEDVDDSDLIPLKLDAATIGINDDATVQSYTPNVNYINTSFEQGIVVLAYLAIPTDDDDFPLIPDNQSYKDALFWYIFRQMLMGGFKPSISGINYEYADSKWKRYCTQAKNQMNMPNIDEYQNFLSTWVKLTPDPHKHSNMFNDMKRQSKFGDNAIESTEDFIDNNKNYW